MCQNAAKEKTDLAHRKKREERKGREVEHTVEEN